MTDSETQPFDIYKAEFSMGQLDYNRYHLILIKADELHVEVLEDNTNAIKEYYAVLLTLYINLRAIMYPNRAKVFDETRSKIIELYKDWMAEQTKEQRKFPISLRDELMQFHENLLKVKQQAGLGIIMSRQQSETEKLAMSSGLEELKFARVEE